MQGNQAALILPYLAIEVPLFFDEHGLCYVPAAPLSQVFGLDHSHEMRRVQDILLHYEMRSFTILHGNQYRRFWTFPYPTSLAAWLMTVWPRVTHTALKEPLSHFIEWGMEVWSQAFKQAQQDFVQMRKQVYDFATIVATAEAYMQRMYALAPRVSPALQTRIHQLDAQWQTVVQPMGTFIQHWLAKKNALPIIETLLIKEGIVASESKTLFGSVSQQDVTTLDIYVQRLYRWIDEMSALLNDLPGGTDSDE